MKAPSRKVRAAVYCRVSTEERLGQAFNSIHAQKEAGEAYVTSQRAEGWVLVPDDYIDAGYSGGVLERPALQRLISDIEEGKIDTIVSYKIDRLSRSISDFVKLVEIFERHDATFVSITQAFNTTTSMGRLTLNVLLSFAQFEREVISERIRDKFSASRRKGFWMGGTPALGYDVVDRKLVVNETEAELVRLIFKRFLRLGSATKLAQELRRAGQTTKSWTTQDGNHRPGKPVDKGFLYKLLNNRVYLGEAVHKGIAYPGEHTAIIGRDLWDKVHSIIQQSPRSRAASTRAQTPALLKGIIFGADGRAMTPTHARKGGRLYRYYVAAGLLKADVPPGVVRRVPAAEIEAAVVDQLRGLLRAPEIIVGTWRSARPEIEALSETEVREALVSLDPIWDELFPTEQARILQLLVERVDVHPDRLDLQLRVDGLQTLIADLRAGKPERRAA